MAVEDNSGDIDWLGKKYRLVLKDYPYAQDGLLHWNAIWKFHQEYLQVRCSQTLSA